MKLLFCKKCEDVFRIRLGLWRSCRCGKTKGRYTDLCYAEYSGEEAVPLGFSNSSFSQAILSRSLSHPAVKFEAFVIPHACDSFKKV